jgi:formyl-CoA transferase/CoA:oxalate CoA-transferase
MIREVEHVAIGLMRTLGVPIKLSETPGGVRTAPPALGQHTASVLKDDLGLSNDDIAGLRAMQVV